MSKPLAIDLYCGLGGWSEGLLIEGYDVVGFDITRHVYGRHCYPAQLVIQDVRTLHGSQFRDAALIVASPPCQAYSWMAMPWRAAKAKAAAIRADETGESLAQLNELFDACFRIQAQASLAAGRHIPMVVENVRGAQPWVGRSRWNFGSFHLWGDVPALMPPVMARKAKGMDWKHPSDPPHRPGGDFTREAANQAIKNSGGSWFRVQDQKIQRPPNDKRRTIAHTPHMTNLAEHGVKQHGIGEAWFDERLDSRRQAATAEKRQRDPMASSSGTSRKFASALIAKIPETLSRHIGRTFHP